jgi:hypothetical protein
VRCGERLLNQNDVQAGHSRGNEKIGFFCLPPCQIAAAPNSTMAEGDIDDSKIEQYVNAVGKDDFFNWLTQSVEGNQKDYFEAPKAETPASYQLPNTAPCVSKFEALERCVGLAQTSLTSCQAQLSDAVTCANTLCVKCVMIQVVIKFFKNCLLLTFKCQSFPCASTLSPVSL